MPLVGAVLSSTAGEASHATAAAEHKDYPLGASEPQGESKGGIFVEIIKYGSKQPNQCVKGLFTASGLDSDGLPDL